MRIKPPETRLTAKIRSIVRRKGHYYMLRTMTVEWVCTAMHPLAPACLDAHMHSTVYKQLCTFSDQEHP